MIFQDFPGPGIFKIKTRTFQEAWEPCPPFCTWQTVPNTVLMIHNNNSGCPATLHMTQFPVWQAVPNTVQMTIYNSNNRLTAGKPGWTGTRTLRNINSIFYLHCLHLSPYDRQLACSSHTYCLRYTPRHFSFWISLSLRLTMSHKFSCKQSRRDQDVQRTSKRCQ